MSDQTFTFIGKGLLYFCRPWMLLQQQIHWCNEGCTANRTL